LVLVQLVGLRDVQNTPIAHYRDPVAHRQQFRIIRADQQNADALRSQLINDIVDIELRADINALRGLVQDQQLRREKSQRATTTFCWLPPERNCTDFSIAAGVMRSLWIYS